MTFPSSGKDTNKSIINSLDGHDDDFLITPDRFGAKPDGKFNNKEAIIKLLNMPVLRGVLVFF